MNEHFLIFGLPRSMTAWVSCFLTCGDVFCQHELINHHPIDEVMKRVRQPFPISGVSDSGMVFFWRDLIEEFPHAKIVWVDRDPAHCMDSFLKATGFVREQMQVNFGGWEIERAEFIQQIEPKVFTFNELQTREGAARLWNYIAPSVPLPPAHLEKMMTLKVVQHPKVSEEVIRSFNALT